MTISEPTTLLTDYLFAAVALLPGVRLWNRAPASGWPPRRLWAAAFLVGAAGAAAGGTVHGFRSSLLPPLRELLWTGGLMAGVLSGALLAWGAASHALAGATRTLVRTAVAVVLLAALGLLASEPLTRHAVWAGAALIAALVALVVASARRSGSFAAAAALGLAIAGAGLLVQHARLALHPDFNHNDLCHVLLIAALFPFYRAGQAIGEIGEVPCP